MASPASTTAHKPPQLSYAAQAKKARNIQPQNSSPAPRAISQTVSVSSTATVISAVPSTSSTTSIAVSPSDPPKPFQPVDTRDQAPATSTVNLPRPSAPMSPIRLESTKKDIQGDVTAEFADSSANEAPPARSQKSASLPPVNVWKKREEQRAQLAQSQAQITVPPPTQHRPAAADPLEKTFPTLSSRSSDTPSGPPSSSFQANNAPVNVSKVSSSLKPPANGQHPPEEHADPFVVRPNLVPSVRLPLAAVDNDNWPTIGDAVPVPSLPSSHGTSDNPIHDPGEQKEKSEEKDTGNIAPKKGTF